MVRTRFAPSPTGDLHLGGLRTALYAWLWARHNNGAFYLRIEDTDRARLVPGSEQGMMDALRTLGIAWDEGPDIGGPYAPYVQSQRLDAYREAAQRLVEQGSAYRCDCPPARLTAVRNAQTNAQQPTKYDGQCRTRTDVNPAQPHVVRFKTPEEGSVTVRDLIHGDLTVACATLDDFVLLKSDGYPTYHLAHVVDDHAMATTHVIRGDEWLPSLPRHVLLFRALGWEPPHYAHLPLLLGKGGKKLSKRDGDMGVATLLTWCLPDALVNFVALLGWNPSGTREMYTRDELVAAFDLAKVNASPAVADFTKLEWMNGEYLRALVPDVLVPRLLLPPNSAPAFVTRVVTIEQTRLKRLDGLPAWYFAPYSQEVSLAGKGSDLATAKDRLRKLHEHLTTLDPWPETPAALEATIKSWMVEQQYGTGETLWPMRVALSGQRASPSPFELAWCFGREETLRRIAHAVAHGE